MLTSWKVGWNDFRTLWRENTFGCVMGVVWLVALPFNFLVLSVTGGGPFPSDEWSMLAGVLSATLIGCLPGVIVLFGVLTASISTVCRHMR